MASRCSHCGAHAPTGAKVCFMCGGQVTDDAVPARMAKTELGTPLQVPSPTAPTELGTGAVGRGTEAAPPGWSPPGTAAGHGQPNAPGPPGGFGPPPGAPSPPPVAAMGAGQGAPAPPGGGAGMHAMGPGPMGAMPGVGYGPPPGKSDDSALKIGCGIAGCFGVVLVLLVVGGALFFLLNAPGPTASGGGPSSGGSPTSEPTAAPNSGSLRSLVKQQVGPYSLMASSPNVADGPFREGAVDSLGLRYESAAGVEVKHFLIVYGTEAQAESKPQQMIEVIRKKVPAGQTFTVRSQPYKNKEGEVIGKVFHVQLDPEVVMWTNGKLYAVANAPAGHALKFFKAVPY